MPSNKDILFKESKLLVCMDPIIFTYVLNFWFFFNRMNIGICRRYGSLEDLPLSCQYQLSKGDHKVQYRRRPGGA